MTKFDLCKLAGLDGFVFDYSIPQKWLDGAVDYLDETGASVPAGFSNHYCVFVAGVVWLYDEIGRVFGRPFPVSVEAENLLLLLPPKFGAATIPAPEREKAIQ